MNVSRCIIEVYKSSAGALWYSVFGLLAFFATTQILSIVHAYLSKPKPSYARPREDREPAPVP